MLLLAHPSRNRQGHVIVGRAGIQATMQLELGYVILTLPVCATYKTIITEAFSAEDVFRRKQLQEVQHG